MAGAIFIGCIVIALAIFFGLCEVAGAIIGDNNTVEKQTLDDYSRKIKAERRRANP